MSICNVNEVIDGWPQLCTLDPVKLDKDQRYAWAVYLLKAGELKAAGVDGAPMTEKALKKLKSPGLLILLEAKLPPSPATQFSKALAEAVSLLLTFVPHFAKLHTTLVRTVNGERFDRNFFSHWL